MDAKELNFKEYLENKRKMDEEGADVQALYEDIKELYKDAQNI